MLETMKQNSIQPPIIFTTTSANSKLSSNNSCGATWLPKATCPGACPHHPDNNGTCYAFLGQCGMHWGRISNSPITDPEVAAKMEAESLAKADSCNPIRIHVAGDFIHEKHLQAVSDASTVYMKNAKVKYEKKELARKTLARKKGLPDPKPKPPPFVWGYTHNMDLPAKAIGPDLSLFRSRETLEQVKKDHSEGWASVLVVSKFEKDREGNTKKSYLIGDGFRVVPCREMTEGVKCVDCQLCKNWQTLRDKKLIVAFEAHSDHADKIVDYVQF